MCCEYLKLPTKHKLYHLYSTTSIQMFLCEVNIYMYSNSFELYVTY